MCLSLVLAVVAEGKTCTWSGGGSGWSDTANWDQVPEAGDTVVVPDKKTAVVGESDFALASSVAAIQLPGRASILSFSSLTTAHAFSVPVTGIGQFNVTGGTKGKYLTLSGDNTGFTGPFLFTDTQVKIASTTALGLQNAVTNIATANSDASNRALVYACAGTFANDLYFAGTYSGQISANVTNTGSMFVKSYSSVFVDSGKSFTQCGAFDYAGDYGAYLGGSGTFTLAGPGKFGAKTTSTQIINSVFASGGQLVIAMPFEGPDEGQCLTAVRGATCFAAADVVGAKHDLQFGTDSLGAYLSYGTFDLNGFDQTCRNLKIYPGKNYTIENARLSVVQSASPATLTVKGEGVNGKSATATQYFKLLGAVSLVLDSSTEIPSTLWLGGQNSGTSGGLYAKRGTLVVESDASFYKLGTLSATGTGVLDVRTASLPANMINAVLADTATLKLAGDVTVRSFKVDGTFLKPKAYAFDDAVFGGRLQGTGTVTVLQDSDGVNARHLDGTMAFYPFEGLPTNAVSSAMDCVRNDADTRFAGTISSAAVSGDADAPGTYVFARKRAGEPVLYRNPRSVNFSGQAGTLSFDALSTAMSSNDDYTVEFFFKQTQESAGTFASLLSFDVGAFYYYPSDKTCPAGGKFAETAVKPYGYDTSTKQHIWYFSNGSCTYRRVKMLWTETDAGSADGYWHHIALVYAKTNHTLSVYRDYRKYGSVDTLTNNVRTASIPMVLGNPSAGTYYGKISCLRVLSKPLAVQDFLRVAATPNCTSETVFHLSFDGAAGTMPTSFPSRVTGITSNDFPNQAWAKKIGETVGITVARTNSDESVVSPTCVAEVPQPRWPRLKSGAQFLCLDGGSALIECKTRTTEAYQVDGAGVDIPGTNHDPVEGGSFTMEGFFKFDFTGWAKRIINTGTKQECQRFTFFGLQYPDASVRHADFILMATYNYNASYKDFNLVLQTRGMVPTTGLFWHTTGLLRDNKWHHYAVVYDDDALTVTLYYDRTAVATGKLDARYVPTMAFSDQTYQIGRGVNNYNCGFMGLVDEVRLTRRALAPEEFLNFDRAAGEGPGLTIILR